MIQQICPNCLDRVDLADETAGTTADCPNCGKPFPVPAAYQPSVDPGLAPAEKPSPPPGFKPPTPPAAPAASFPTGPTEPPAPPTGYESVCAATLSPMALAWTAVVSVSVVFVLSFFSWVGAFPGGYRAYTQTPWQAVPGWISMQTSFEETYDELPLLEARVPSDWVLVLPYLVFLVLAVVIGWVWLTVTVPDADRLPRAVRWLPRIWPAFPTILAGLIVAMFVLLVLQLSAGFGLETAVDARVAEQVAEIQAKDEAGNRLPRPFLIGETAGRYDVQTTTAAVSAFALHIVALLAMVGWLWLRRRGSKPHPRLLAQW